MACTMVSTVHVSVGGVVIGIVGLSVSVCLCVWVSVFSVRLCFLCVCVSCVWDKQWKSRCRCLDKFTLGRSRGKSDFPEGRSPEGKSDYPRDFPWANFQTTPKAFPQLVRLKGFKNRRECVPQE